MDEIGSLLKDAREASGVSVAEAGKDISVKESILENIESGCIGAFKDVYELKDIIHNYSKYLGLNPEEMVDKFNDYLFEYTSKIPLKEIEKAVNEMQKTENDEEEKVLSPYTKEHKKNYVKQYVAIGVVLVLLISLLVWWATNLVAIGVVTTNLVAYSR